MPSSNKPSKLAAEFSPKKLEEFNRSERQGHDGDGVAKVDKTAEDKDDDMENFFKSDHVQVAGTKQSASTTTQDKAEHTAKDHMPQVIADPKMYHLGCRRLAVSSARGYKQNDRKHIQSATLIPKSPLESVAQDKGNHSEAFSKSEDLENASTKHSASTTTQNKVEHAAEDDVPQMVADLGSINCPRSSGPDKPMQSHPPLDAEKKLLWYFISESPEFQRCDELRKKVRRIEKLDNRFDTQRLQDNSNDDDSTNALLAKMKAIAIDINNKTQSFKVSRGGHGTEPPLVLDFGMAPGGFLEIALQEARKASLNFDMVPGGILEAAFEEARKSIPEPRAHAFTLRSSEGGHEASLSLSNNTSVKIHHFDLILLTEAMFAWKEKSPEDRDEENPFAKCIGEDKLFDIVICDATRLNPRRQRDSPRDSLANRENVKLLFSQLVLGLGSVKLGGTMVVRLSKLDHWLTARVVTDLMKTFKVQLYKSGEYRKETSSFYLVAKDLFKDRIMKKQKAEVLALWRKVLEVAFLRDDEALKEAMGKAKDETEDVIEVHGGQLVQIGRNVWKTQADALAELVEKARAE